MKYIIIKEAWGWQIKEFNGKAPAGKSSKSSTTTMTRRNILRPIKMIDII